MYILTLWNWGDWYKCQTYFKQLYWKENKEKLFLLLFSDEKICISLDKLSPIQKENLLKLHQNMCFS